MAQSPTDNVANPVIPGMNADPSVCRVGEEFYLVTSSNEYLPGLPVYHSTDLVSWEHIGDVITRESQMDLSKAESSLGLFAPTIRYHDGVFFVLGTNVGAGHFVVTATDPAGPWGDPVWIDGPGWDPSIAFDDGRAWFHYSTGREIRCFELDVTTGSRIGGEVDLWRGTGGDAPEGPHLYLFCGWWYLVIAEGGTSAGHAVTIARSRQITGPYEPHPRNPVLTHRGLSSPFQGIGHADLVERSDGGWSAVVLGARPIGGHGHQLLGRETFLVDVEWGEDAWPVLGMDGRVPLTTGRTGVPFAITHDESFDGELALGWLSVRGVPRFAEAGDGLRLHPSTLSLDDVGIPSFLGRRMLSHTATCSVMVAVQDSTCAGLALRRDELHHYSMMLGRGRVVVTARIGDLFQEVASAPVLADGLGAVAAELRVRALPDLGSNPLSGSGFFEFDWRMPGGEWVTLSRLQSRYLSTELAGGFTGIIIGMLATSAKEDGAPAVFRHWHSGETGVALEALTPKGLR